ncbi:unnamed protein product [Vitrella brassicaformis CCMP3155]|uniref:Uncharacterized protein n=1 Tax=Vitrella brassicaformis (strain CCMP3155) TaxID=1169540 RepID=A0A0G4EHI1_VITBC|nr:unnamed protein product [Vitrella brassicaformis CCMP3155]|eukprot:CEL95640.1 unnamed protein product [Vitrella brassicaformis CCMP3155]
MVRQPYQDRPAETLDRPRHRKPSKRNLEADGADGSDDDDAAAMAAAAHQPAPQPKSKPKGRPKGRARVAARRRQQLKGMS